MSTVTRKKRVPSSKTTATSNVEIPKFQLSYETKRDPPDQSSTAVAPAAAASLALARNDLLAMFSRSDDEPPAASSRHQQPEAPLTAADLVGGVGNGKQQQPTSTNVDVSSMQQQHRRDKLLAEIPKTWYEFPFSDVNSYEGVCWWDSHKFADVLPVCIPTSYNIRTREFTHWHGVFCSWGCACAYAQANAMPKSVAYMHQMRIDAGLPLMVGRAPHFSKLRTHGGTLEIEEFRSL